MPSRPRGSTPLARSRSIRPTWPGSSARSSRSGSAASSPTVVTPAAARRSSARGPTPGSARTANGARKRGLGAGGDDRDPAGLAPVGRDLRHHLRRRDAERAGEARRRAHRGLHGLGDGPGARVVGGEPGEVEVALVEPGPLDARDDLAHRRPDGLRVLAVERVARADEDRVRAASQRLGAAHRGVDAEAARDVVRGRDDTASLRVAADDERLSPQLRLLELLHGGEEGVQVEMGENRHHASMIDAPALPPPAIVAPAPREVSFGLVAGTAPLGTRRIIVHVGRYVAAEEPLRGRSFSLHVRLTGGPTTIRVTAVDGRNRRSSRLVEPVYGLPQGSEPRAARAAARPGPRSHDSHARAAARRHERDLRPGPPHRAGRRLERRRALPRRLDAEAGDRGHRPPLARAQARVVHAGRTAARQDARQLRQRRRQRARGVARRLDLGRLGPGQRDDAGARARRTRSCTAATRRTRRPAAATAAIPIRVESQPAFGVGKYTTAADLARLARAVYLAAAGKGPLLRLGVSGSEARYLLWLLAQVTDRGKLDRFFGSAVVMHKAGWLTERPARQRHRRLSTAASSSRA